MKTEFHFFDATYSFKNASWHLKQSQSKMKSNKKIGQLAGLLFLIALIPYVNQNSDYFVLIENNGSFENSDLKYKFPFDKKLVSNERNGIMNSISDNYQQIEINPPKDWGGYVMKPRNRDNVEVQFYSKYNSRLEEEVIDSLMKKEIKSITNEVQNGK